MNLLELQLSDCKKSIQKQKEPYEKVGAINNIRI